MEILILPATFSVCKVADPSVISLKEPYSFISITDEEISLVCPEERVPSGTLAREDGWRGFRLQGVLEFTMVGVLARISALLAAEQISIFAISTYNTDYVFTKEVDFDRAVALLAGSGYPVLREPTASLPTYQEGK